MLDIVLLPPDTQHLVIYYLFWILAFLVVNTIWDVKTDKTPAFHLEHFKDKVGVLHDAATFCSSLLIITSLASPTVRALARDTTIPLVVAGVSGMLRSIPALCPYKADRAK